MGEASEMIQTHIPIPTLDRVHNTHMHLGVQSEVKTQINTPLPIRTLHFLLKHRSVVTHNLYTYFISVRRVFLEETVVLQTVLEAFGGGAPIF